MTRACGCGSCQGTRRASELDPHVGSPVPTLPRVVHVSGPAGRNLPCPRFRTYFLTPTFFADARPVRPPLRARRHHSVPHAHFRRAGPTWGSGSASLGRESGQCVAYAVTAGLLTAYRALPSRAQVGARALATESVPGTAGLECACCGRRAASTSDPQPALASTWQVLDVERQAAGVGEAAGGAL